MAGPTTPGWNEPTGSQNTQITNNADKQFLDTWKSLTPSARKAAVERMRKAGFKAADTQQLGPQTLDSLREITNKATEYNMRTQSNLTADQWLELRRKEIEALGGGAGSGGPTVYRQQMNDTDASALISQVMRDQVGRGPTEAELRKYTQAIHKAQAANPTVVSQSGNTQTQTGGIDPQELLIQQLSRTDEAKATKVLGFYDAFRNALGVK